MAARTSTGPNDGHAGTLALICRRCHGQPFMRKVGGPPRNVLLQRVERVGGVTQQPTLGSWVGEWVPTGERVVRPFRGLRRWPPSNTA